MQPTTSGETARKLSGDGRSIIDSTKKIAKETLDLLGSSIAEIFKNRALSGSPADSLRALSSWQPENEVDRVARSMILLSAYRAEQISPSAAYLFLKLLSGQKILSSAPRRMLDTDLSKLASIVQDATIQSLISEAVHQAGSTGNISVSLGGVTHIAVDDSAMFPVIVSPSFRNAFTLTRRKIVVFDGVIETVGQINSFLESCAKEKASILLVARAFSSEVASTIHANNQRKSFDIVPLTPGVSFEDEFTINDIAAIAGLYHRESIALDSATDEHEVIVENGMLKVSLRNSTHRDSLSASLRAELRQFSDKDVSFLLGKRLARISSRRVSVCIGEEFGSTKDIAKERFDYGMRCYISARRKGIIEVDGDMYPGESLRIAKSAHEAFSQLVRNTGGSLVIDKKMAVAKRRRCESRRL